jgi:flavin-dependent dehydrogenase
MMVVNTDVVIVGAGPAGACAALSLLTYSTLKVVVLEQSDFSQPRVGEHVSDSLFSLLAYLKLTKADFPAHCFMPCYGDTAYWGSDLPRVRHAIFSSENASVQLDREAFDFTLLEQIVARGGSVYPRTHFSLTKSSVANSAATKSSVTKCAADAAANWILQCTHPEQPPFQINARYVIDASGRSSSWSRQLGGQLHKLDQLMGAGRFFSLPGTSLKGASQPERPQQQIIESCEHGWWYGALLPNQHYVATFFSDADIISKLRLNQHQHWQQLLQQTSHLKHAVADAQALSAHPWVRNAASQYSDVSQIEHFIAIGDAACAFDPISSMGLGFAISSACHAARLVINELAPATTPPDLDSASTNHAPAKQLYQHDLHQHFSGYQTLRQSFYRAEARWSNAPFWQRRQLG